MLCAKNKSQFYLIDKILISTIDDENFLEIIISMRYSFSCLLAINYRCDVNNYRDLNVTQSRLIFTGLISLN